MRIARLPDPFASTRPSATDDVDPAFAALLADPRVALREPPEGVSLDDMRIAANRFMARAKGPDAVTAAEHEIEGAGGAIALRLYRSPTLSDGRVIVFVHGGGFILGSLDSHDALCRQLAVSASASILAVDYRLAPESPYPAALNDVGAAIAWLRQEASSLGLDASRLAIAGDSAGGQLAIAATLREISSDRPVRHVALLYPLVDPTTSTASESRYAEGFMLTGSFVRWAWRAYRGDAQVSADPLFDLRLASFDAFPPTSIVVAGIDPLCEEGEEIAHRLYMAGVPTELRRYTAMIHGFVGLPHLTPSATHALDFIGQRISAALAPCPTLGAA